MPAHRIIRVVAGIALATALAGCSSMPGTRAQAATEVDQAWAEADGPLLAAVIAGPWRGDANRARDRYRHPDQTLRFFGVGAR